MTKAQLVERRAALFGVRNALAAPGKPTRFPFIPYGEHDVRAIQGYLTKLPQALFAVIPELLVAGATAPALSQPTPAEGWINRPANEALAVSERDPFSVDPALVQPALRGHARTQNALAAHLHSAGATPLSPVAGGPNFDLAWEQDDEVWVAEVKSCSPSNMENQLRLGLGQVLRYRSILADRFHKPVRAMLVVQTEPLDPAWKTLCSDLGIDLRWPETFK